MKAFTYARYGNPNPDVLRLEGGWTSPPPGPTKRSYGLLEAGRISPSIDKSHRFTEFPEALRYLGEGHDRGKIVATVAG